MTELQTLDLSPDDWKVLLQSDEYCKRWNGAERSGFEMSPEAMCRQMRTAGEILSRLRTQRGVLLADDVGMGKTAVAIFVAAIFSSKGYRVRVLAPNKVMRRKWEIDLRQHLEALGELDSRLGLSQSKVRGAGAKRLRAGKAIVETHALKPGKTLACELLIVDEAHRARGEKTQLRLSLHKQRKQFQRVLFLTATPFSIDIKQLKGMLEFIGAENSELRNVLAFSRSLTRFWSPGAPQRAKDLNRLLDARTNAINAIKQWVIRHSVKNREQSEMKRYGSQVAWTISVPPADEKTLEVLLRADRTFALAKRVGCCERLGTNDARNHVGWGYLIREVEIMSSKAPSAPQQDADCFAFNGCVGQLKAVLHNTKTHQKASVVTAAVADRVRSQNEKVLVFCYHHSTAVELAELLFISLADAPAAPATESDVWVDAWHEIVDHDEELLKSAFIAWLSSSFIKRQIEAWLPRTPRTVHECVGLLSNTKVRFHGTELIAAAAQALLNRLTDTQSKSTRQVLKFVAEHPSKLEGELPCSPVVSVADPGSVEHETVPKIFFSHQQPDTLMEIFNSPFGPEVLVATDRLSEGVDLHRYCRHLVHYELSPSPIRVVQRNGRIRRLNSWAARVEEPICVAYPFLRGTRDEKLVAIMEQRLGCFELLLGGIGAKLADEDLQAGSREFHEAVAKLHANDRGSDPLAV
jgi:ERCC4-related helicase